MSSIEDKTKVHLVADLPGDSAQSACLVIIGTRAAASLGRMLKLEHSEVVLGRSAEAELQLEDEGISRKHAKVLRGADGRYQLVDLGSTNGTFVNGVRVSSVPLFDGDRIQVGPDTVLKFSLQDPLEEQYHRNIYDSATRDPLTRIYNKRYFLEALHKEFAYCVRHGVALALVLFDIDHFKQVNDEHGHLAGDSVLALLAQRVADTVRTEDLLARYGGEEFALLLRETDEAAALACAERCRVAVETTDFGFGGRAIPVSISLGVALLDEPGLGRPEDLIAAADRYLYRAKRGGRNRVEARALGGPG